MHQFSPSPIADLSGLLCRAHDVREKDRGQNSVEIGLLIADVREQASDVPCDRVGPPIPVVLIVTIQLDQRRTRDVISEVPPGFRRIHPSAVNVLKDQRRHVDRGKDRPNVGSEETTDLRDKRARTDRRSQIPEKPPLLVWVGQRLGYQEVACRGGPRADPLLPLLRRWHPRRFGSRRVRDEGVSQDESSRPLRIRGGPKRRDQGAVPRSEDGSPIGAHRIHHHEDVVGEHLERRDVRR
jgi:hypothetical protein